MKQLLIDDKCVEVTDDDVLTVLKSKIGNIIPEVCDAIIVGDLGEIVGKHSSWTSYLPDIEPFYVVKCNDDPAVLSVLAQLGTGFICYSKAEIQRVLKLHVPPNQILYGSPCRPSSQLQYAVQHGIKHLTFESEAELRKLSGNHRSAKLLLRVNPFAEENIMNEQLSFGCHLGDVYHLLKLAKQLETDVIGISVHIDVDNHSLSALCSAVMMARAVFDLADEIGFNLSVLDIGGDCIARQSSGVCFEEFADVLRSSLQQSFCDRGAVRVIVECGNYFVESAFTVAVGVVDERTEIRNLNDISPDDAEACNDCEISSTYYVSDGVYGSFGRVLVDQHAIIEPTLLNPSKYAGEQWYTSSIRGPTCDSLDCLVSDFMLPRLSMGDWLAFRDMGAFLFSSSRFQLNKALNVERFYIIQEGQWLQLCLSTQSKSSPEMQHMNVEFEWELCDNEPHTT